MGGGVCGFSVDTPTRPTDSNLCSLRFLRTVTRHFSFVLTMKEGQDSSVVIATRYRLDGPGIESRWAVKFSANV